MPKLLKNRRRHQAVRVGAAAVEMAVCIPTILLLLVATLDVCGMFKIQQSLKVSAYEGARIGVVPGAESKNVNFQCEAILDAHGVNSYTVSMTPSDPATLAPGDYFTVSIDANFDANAYGSALHSGKVLTKSVTLRVE